jgi:hypothetical protein
LYDSFFPKDSATPAIPDENSTRYDLFISADKIFQSNVAGLEDFFKIFSMEFCVSRFSLFDGAKSSDAMVLAQDVKIHMSSGSHCAMIQGRLAKGVAIPKIIVKKVTLLEKIECLETIEFSQCVAQSFSIVERGVLFSFRYSSYSYSYKDFKEDGTLRGSAAVAIDLAKWETENS